MLGESVRVLVLMLVYLEAVSCLDTVHGYLKESVVLPCSYSEDPPVDISVFWRDLNDDVVLDIMNGVESLQIQDQRYKGRVSSFPHEYSKKNVSIVMKDLQQEDAGTYECKIPSLRITKSVNLNVTEKPSPNPRLSSPSGGAAGTNFFHPFVFCALGLLHCF